MSTAGENPFAGQGSVLLDIGGEIGAVVVTMPAGMEGVEVEIRPVEGHEHGARAPGLPGHPHHPHHPHVAVVNRPVGRTQVPSLVFPEVEQGRYGLYLKQTNLRTLTVDVVGGSVTTEDWPA